MPKYSWNLHVLSIIWKLKNWKILLKNGWKIGTPFGRRGWKIGTPFDTLARQVEKLARLWHAFGTLGRGHVDHAGIHGTHDKRFSKLIKYRFTIMDKIFIQGLDFLWNNTHFLKSSIFFCKHWFSEKLKEVPWNLEIKNCGCQKWIFWAILWYPCNFFRLRHQVAFRCTHFYAQWKASRHWECGQNVKP